MVLYMPAIFDRYSPLRTVWLLQVLPAGMHTYGQPDSTQLFVPLWGETPSHEALGKLHKASAVISATNVLACLAPQKLPGVAPQA